tara:strand:- start:49 stop:807 length:759 start_codon:yes stop_codon:yes gene_type:complete
MKEILLITAHPDDEIIWFGSTIYELNKLEDINISIICLWGILEPPGSMQSVMPGYKDIDRKEQFNEVCKSMGIKKYFAITDVDSHVYKGINQTYNNILHEFKKTIKKINIKNIDMIITHSNYGDEHKHNGHTITNEFSKIYCKNNNIPFSFFSILQLPQINHISILKNTYRKNQLHVLNYSKCSNDMFYIQFQGNLTIKIELFNLYKAVDVQAHINNIFGCTTISEGLYFSKEAKPIIDFILSKINKISNVF